jgi:hypothetical protein
MQISSKKRWLIWPVILFLAAMVIACGGSAGSKATNSESADSAGQSSEQKADQEKTDQQEEPTSEPVAAEPGTSRSNPLPLGSTVELEDWKVTVAGYKQGEEAVSAITAANQFNEAPAEGTSYVLVDLAVEYTGDAEEAQSPLIGLDLRLTGSKHLLYGSAMLVPEQALEGQLFKGGKAEGQRAFVIAADEDNLMMRVQQSFSLSAEPVFVALNEGASLSPDPALKDIMSTDAGKSKEAPAKVGETLVGKAWEVSVLEVLRGEEALSRIMEANQFNQAPEAGKEYVAVRLHVRSLASGNPDELALVNGALLKITGEKGVIYEQPFAVAPDPILDASLFPGASFEGWEVLEVEEGEAGLVLIFEPLFSLSKADRFFIALQ